ncbi:MAG: hypothetical protein ACLQNG_07370 [Acidimicrobiales bacterium]|jgi:hypothetical protein
MRREASRSAARGLPGLLSSAALCTLLLISTTPALASTWLLVLKSGSSAEAHAQPAPSTPTGVSATCVSSSEQKVTVAWTTVTHASSYTIFDSTTSATTGYVSAASGVSGTPWTSGTLSAANYWFEVAAYVGTTWVSANSSATAETTIKTSGTKCTQP